MKKLFIGILLSPVIIFAVGLILVLAAKSLDFILPSHTPSPKPISEPTIRYAATRYYDVIGSTRDEIRANMTQAKQGTFLEGHDAATTVETNINFARRQLADKCEAVMTQFDLIFTCAYPRWTPPQGAPQDLVARWNAFIEALKVHEEGHAKIETEQAAVVLQELQKIPAYSTCEAFDEAWQAKADALDQETKEIEAQYDRDTESGNLQGVVF